MQQISIFSQSIFPREKKILEEFVTEK